MKLVAVTQRVDLHPSHGERRDALDQRWSRFLAECGLLPLLLPNDWSSAEKILSQVTVAGYLLTGGNDVQACHGDVPERDAVERALIARAIRDGQPLIGVCRGMQSIQEYFGVTFERVEGHVTARQTISVDGASVEVNSYHRWGTRVTAPDLTVTAHSPDGVVKAIRHVGAPLFGVMWHPERMRPFADRDCTFFRQTFGERQS